jgi:hypothetical protein
MPKRLILSLVIVCAVALPLTMVADPRGFEELAERAAVADQANASATKCPLSREYIDKADIGLLSICVSHGLGAFEAAQRYPASAPKVFAVYGEDETFRKVLDEYGHQVIPVVAFFVENGSREFQIRQALGEALQQMWAGQKPKWEPSKITREQIGLIAIHRIAVRGHEMLAEFEIVDGIAKGKPVTSFILGAKNFFLGGVGDLETILVRGERLPTWKEVGLAALDATIVSGGVGAVAKTARVGERAVVEKSTGRLMVEGGYEAISAVGKASWRVAPIAFLYVAITRPALITSLGGWIAEQFGINRLVGIFAVYAIGILLVLQFLWPLVWCGRILGWPYRRLRNISAHRPQRCLRAQAAFGAS